MQVIIPSVRTELVTYTAKDGFDLFLSIFTGSLLFAIISFLIVLFIKMNYKDKTMVFLINIVTKTGIYGLCSCISSLIHENILVGAIQFLIILVLIPVIEGIIYKRILTYKKKDGNFISLITNVSSFIILFLVEYLR